MKSSAILLFSVSTAILTARGISAADRHPMATRAEADFFNALNASPENRPAAIRELTGAYALDPSDARTSVLLGLAHLWTAAEGNRQDPSGLDHLILAEKFLARAAALDPNDERIPSWLVPARITLATLEKDPARVREAFASLREVCAKRSAFHSFTLALLAVQRPPDSPEFQQGLAALRKTIQGDCLDRKDVACGNRPHWPHNAEGISSSRPSTRPSLETCRAPRSSWPAFGIHLSSGPGLTERNSRSSRRSWKPRRTTRLGPRS